MPLHRIRFRYKGKRYLSSFYLPFRADNERMQREMLLVIIDNGLKPKYVKDMEYSIALS